MTGVFGEVGYYGTAGCLVWVRGGVFGDMLDVVISGQILSGYFMAERGRHRVFLTWNRAIRERFMFWFFMVLCAGGACWQGGKQSLFDVIRGKALNSASSFRLNRPSHTPIASVFYP